jgi:hypothetical protein
MLEGNGYSVQLSRWFTPGKDPVPIEQQVAWASRPGFDSRTVRPVTSRHIEYAIPVANLYFVLGLKGEGVGNNAVGTVCESQRVGIA